MNGRIGVPLWAGIGGAVAAAAVTVIVVTVVVGTHDQTPTTAPPASTSTSVASSAPAPTISATPKVVPVVNTPASVATGFVAAFTNRDLSSAAWEKAYSVYLTDASKTAYQGTDQGKVPGTKITGKAVVTAGGSTTGTTGTADAGDTDPAPAIVTVPTDAGPYNVNLQQVDGSWQVLSATTPDAN